MALRVYNTLTRTKEAFEPVSPGKVGIYLCGPTVYDRAHIGHMVGPVIFDTVKRYLVHSGYDVTWVVNITDVDDKLIKKSRELGVSMADVARDNTADYLQNLAGLGVDQIDHMPKATESMDEIVALIVALIEKGFAYEADGDVFFDVARDRDYGKLTNRTVDALQGEGGDAAAKKRSAADFALWKAAKPGEPSWESPWGPGRPGWHIECSAMSRSLLGKTFDIHGGGLDLIFPHHENEIAQSECCHSAPMAKYWLHNGLLKRSAAGKIGGRADRTQATASPAEVTLESIQQATAEKESRSGGAGGLAAMIDQFGGELIRFFLLRTHYRSTVVYSDEALQEASTALETFYRFVERFQRVTGTSFYELPIAATRGAGQLEAGNDATQQQIARCRESFLEKMDDDFNTGGAISDLFELARLLNKFVDQNQLEDAPASPLVTTLRQGSQTLRELAALLGLFLKPVAGKASESDSGLVAALMDLVLELRAAARQKKDFATADRIRDVLSENGVVLEDRKGGTDWRVE